MNMHARDAVVTGFEPLIDVLDLPDPDDRHVLAAAIKGRADLIVTSRRKARDADGTATAADPRRIPDIR